MFSPEKRKRCVLRVLAGEKQADVARSERVDEKTLQRWVKADAPKDKDGKRVPLSEKPVDVPSRGNDPDQGVDPKIEAALGKVGGGTAPTVTPVEIAAQKALTLQEDEAFCLSAIKTSKAASVVMVAPFLRINPANPKLQQLTQLSPGTVETIKANAGPLAAELRKVIGDNLYLVGMALLAETVVTAFGMYLLFRELYPKKEKSEKAEKAHEAAHEAAGPAAPQQ